ncbi:MAG TPA: alpha-1,4-glucan--maltose-1-phosphate maltosyltransferase [Gammaproteobacteria bacterium]|nr:alpha-1,4-glucan--maltose-1-phosphate maltosyltransferase [Gammaproteobacteria bacterium]
MIETAVTGADDGRRRVVIESLAPEIDCGKFAAKRVLGERCVVEADAFTDGHEQIVCVLRHRHADERDWRETRMRALGNDRWRGTFTVERLGRYEYTVAGWVDRFLSWRQELARRRDPADIAAALEIGTGLVQAAIARAFDDAAQLTELGARLSGNEPLEARRELALSEELEILMLRHPDRRFETVHERVLELVADRERARFSTWYELFPRSLTARDSAAHGDFATTAARLPYISGMGFDVLYLPPIHPIGRSRRKGRNNSLAASPEDPGSPWAIGSEEGGHKSIHPALGTLEDFRALLEAAGRHGIEIALDIALQCSPDHPYVREHPDWFKHRPDGSVQYAENPPKKYEDIYPFDFECNDWRGLWAELESIFEFWAGQGVKIFRVDNPHTKPFGFWRWLIAEVKRKYPEAIFLAEAFSRPRVMHRLAKLGFTQSYTYFTWRNTKHELVEYLTELTHSAAREYFRPNFWPNTPDILHEYLQFGGRPAFMCRAVLAATLAASYGIYGPAFELLEAAPREPGMEEYLDSEKYELRRWDLDAGASLGGYIGRLNRLRRENAALQSDWSLRFHPTDNGNLLGYSKENESLDNIVLVVANLDPHHVQAGHVEIPLHDWGIPEDRPYQVHDLLSGARYLWHGPRNYVALDPQRSPAHVFRLRRYVRTERDFDYFM